jgi:hypothetical protein
MELPPAQLFPARSALTRTLADYEASVADIAQYEAKIARADVDEAEAINADITETESADRITRTQNLRNVFRARLAAKETAKAKLLTQLSAALNAGHNEFSALVGDLVATRRETLRGRVLVAGQLGEDSGTDVDVMLESAKPISELRGLEVPSASITYCDRAETIAGMAKRILAGYEALELQRRKQI